MQGQWMQLALRLAAQGRGLCHPNPMVGAVVVQGGELVGQGYHRGFGELHAERAALEAAARRTHGASLYVTLEPCSTWGKQPPCVEAILHSGVRSVVVAMRDPNPQHMGRGIRWLRRHGIEVKLGCLKSQAVTLNEAFVKYQTQGLPFVIAKWAQSLDGKIATANGASRWITSLEARRFAHKLRSESDAILVGVNTILKDDPELTNRLYQPLLAQQPIKVIVDSRLRTPLHARIFSGASPAPTVVLTTSSAPETRLRQFQAEGVRVLVVKARNRLVDLDEGLRALGRIGIQQLLLEGGGELIASVLAQRMVDRVVAIVAPKIIGGRSAKTAVEGDGVRAITQAWPLKELKVDRLGEDLVISGRVAPHRA